MKVKSNLDSIEASVLYGFTLARYFLLVLSKPKMTDNIPSILLKDDDTTKNNLCQTAAELSDYLKLALKNVLDSVSDEKFVSIYKACYKEFEKKSDIGRPALSGSSTEGRKYHSQFNEIVSKTTNRTIEETVSDMNSNLKELEELKLTQSGANIVWRPPGQVAEHMRPFECVSEMEKKKELESKIEREQEALNILKARLSQKRCKARELHEVLLSLIDEIKHIVTNKVDDEELN